MSTTDAATTATDAATKAATDAAAAVLLPVGRIAAATTIAPTMTTSTAPTVTTATATIPPIATTTAGVQNTTEVSLGQWMKDVVNTIQKTFIMYVIYISALFGGIIGASYSVREGEGPARRFLSFLYGFAWYPLSLAYALYDTPQWYATLYPLYEGVPGFLSYTKPTLEAIPMKDSKGSKTLRIVSGILLVCNIYVIVTLIRVRFYM
jgi:hypothetical protein